MKKIVMCFDGTWNDASSLAGQTNVYRLFRNASNFATLSTDANELEQSWTNPDTGIEQVCRYIHGVGDENGLFAKVFGGAFGDGTSARVVRGHTFVSRHYEPGDEIYIVGFSRGAYAARTLARFIAGAGLLDRSFSISKENAWQSSFALWADWRRATGLKYRGNWWSKFCTGCAALMRTSDEDKYGDKRPSPAQVVHVDSIRAVAVWDTVGSIGLPNVTQGKNIDAYQYDEPTLGKEVNYGFQALAFDEQRVLFTPSFWESREGVEQEWFAGAHADVGGGYPAHGLSDITLAWMQSKLKAATGLVFANQYPGQDSGSDWYRHYDAPEHTEADSATAVGGTAARDRPPQVKMSEAIKARNGKTCSRIRNQVVGSAITESFEYCSAA